MSGVTPLLPYTRLWHGHDKIYFLPLISVFESHVKLSKYRRSVRIRECHLSLQEGYANEIDFFFLTQQPLFDQDLLIFDTSRSHSGTPQSVGLLCTGDQLDSENST
jgi:hypothetical protein